ncbi:MAG TPA: nucleotide exchange factor GrpE [Microbacteriaceae bacterium]|nr:nucleotide exchange factor GrpE [Microbacteriaceae bacterium]
MSEEEHRNQENAENAEDAGLPTPNGEESSADGEELTVEDILGEEQTAAAKAEDAEAAESEGVEPDADIKDEGDNPYLDDLRRLTAEFANYRKRTEANREVEAHRAKARVLEPLLDVLDDLDRAEQHGDLVEGTPFLAIAKKIRAILEKQGLEAFGEKGEVFDPQHHEAIAQVPVPGTEDQTVLDVIERGYRIGEVELRPARVAVAVNPDG